MEVENEELLSQDVQSSWRDVDDASKPSVGLVFESLEAGYEFYKTYAKLCGFSVRKSATMVDTTTKERYSQQFVCSKQGKPVDTTVVNSSNNEEPSSSNLIKRRKRAVTKEDCMAQIRIQKDDDGRWSIRRFVEEHSHICVTPRKQQFLRCNRTVSEAQKSLLSTFKEANIRTSEFMSFMEIENEGFSNINCTEKDIRNSLQRDRDGMRPYDVDILLEHFHEEKEMNPSFCFHYKVDEDNKLTHVLWVDAIARKAFKHFGEVLIFDTTYDTNEYKLVFAPFTGVNHHGQSVNFGAAFINKETTDSFVWLFQKWGEIMGGSPPKVIITDQDPAMDNAIRMCFPGSSHRLCMWHILKKLPDKLGGPGLNSDFSIPFHSCIWESETPEEFEMRWNDVMHANVQIAGCPWLSDIYLLREKWIPAYAKHIFTAGIRTTQRSESMNAFVDKYVSSKNSLHEFLTRFERAIRKQRQNQLAADYTTLHTKPKLQTGFEIESQMSEQYTRSKFHIFQAELVESLNYASLMKADDGSVRHYIVRRMAKSVQHDKTRDVVYKGMDIAGTCTCSKFEVEGIPCRHILVVLRNEFVDSLPQCYILKRWTASVTTEIVYDDAGAEIIGSYGSPQDLDMVELSNEFNKVMRIARSSKEMRQKAKTLLVGVVAELQQDMPHESQQPTTSSLPRTVHIQVPDIAKTKGSGKRIKGGREKALEMAAKPLRKCRLCNKMVNHDSRTCPLKQSSTINESQASTTVPTMQPIIEDPPNIA